MPAMRDRRLLRRLARDGFFVLAAAFIGLRLFDVQPWEQSVDAYAYWATRDGMPYGAAVLGKEGAYLYSPAFAQLVAPLALLPWAVFNAVWTAINLGAYRLVVGRAALLLLLVLPVPFEIVSGNVHLLFALAIVIGFTFPATWAFLVLTKVTPGVGLIWFLVRREWRSLGIALGVTAAITAISYIVAPSWWSEWVSVLTASQSGPGATHGWYLPVGLLPRLVIAAVLVAWGGLTDRRWTVPVAVTLAMPVVWLNSLAVLVALVPLTRPAVWGLQERLATRLPARP